MGISNSKSNADRLGTDRIPRLILRLSIPSTIGLIVSASYNLVDTLFVGRLGVAAITALTIVFPLQMILTALAQGTGIGTQSFIARMLGKGKRLEASHAALISLILAGIYWVITAGIGLFFIDDIIRIFSSDPEVISFGVAYGRIIFLGSFALFYLRAALNILRAQGNYFLPMIVLIVTASLNIVLDPILIFGMFGIPAFGVEGAAIATVGARIIGCLVISYVLLSHYNEIGFRFKQFRFDTSVISNIFMVGIPTIMIDLVLGITLAGTNKILDGMAMATVLIAGVGIYFRLQSIILTPVLGLSRSLIPIIGYNYGAEKYRRVWETLRIALVFSLLVSLIAFVLFEFFPGSLISFFNSDVELVAFGSVAFQRMSLLFFLVGPSLVVLTFFQGIGRATRLFIVLAIRQFLLFFPILFLLTVWYGHPTLWFAFPIADAFAVVIGSILIYFDIRRLKLAKAIPWVKYKE